MRPTWAPGRWRPLPSGSAGLLVVDLAVSRIYFGVNPPALVAGMAVGVCLLLAAGYLFPGALLAAAASLLISWVVYRVDSQITRHELLWPRTAGPAWPRAGGLLLLVCWSLRALCRGRRRSP